MVSKAACPANPSRKLPTACRVESWNSWSSTSRATATLVSTRSCAPLPLVGITQGAHVLVGDQASGCRDDQAAITLHQFHADDRFDAERGPIGDDLDLAGA